MMNNIKIEMCPVENIIPYSNNAKLHSQEHINQIKASILEFGFNDPIAVDENNIIIEGHGRLEALKQLEYKEAPIIKLNHLSEAQKKAYILAHNKLTMNSGFDDEVLRLELERIDELDLDLSLVGFSEDELSDIFKNTFDDELKGDDFDESLPINPYSELGDVWILGEHRLVCGDSTKIEDVKKLCGDTKVDLFLSDPPYNVDYAGRTKEKLKIDNDRMDDEEFINFLAVSFTRASEVMKRGATFYIWHADLNSLFFRLACKRTDWSVKQVLIWSKNSLVMGRQDYHWKHEPCLYGWKEGASHNWYSDRKQTTILEFNRPSASRLHPTMKPISLMAYQIQNSTKEDDIVLDLFGGSGSTLIASEQINRTCYTMEISPGYTDVVVKRYYDLVRESGGIPDIKHIRNGSKQNLTEFIENVEILYND